MTMTPEVLKEAENYKQYIGKPAITYTDNYCNDQMDYHTIIEMQTNMIEDVTTYEVVGVRYWEFLLKDGKKTKGFGKLKNEPIRSSYYVFNSVEAVLRKINSSIVLNHRYEEIARTKEDLDTGNLFWTISFDKNNGEFHVDTVYIKEYSVKKGFIFNNPHVKVEDIYGKNELNDLLKKVENYVSTVLPYEETEEETEIKINSKKYVITILEANGAANTRVLDSTRTQEEVITIIKQEFGDKPCMIIAVNTETKKVFFQDYSMQ